jgi:hypothetical protein
VSGKLGECLQNGQKAITAEIFEEGKELLRQRGKDP